jgi:competence protein ComEC
MSNYLKINVLIPFILLVISIILYFIFSKNNFNKISSNLLSSVLIGIIFLLGMSRYSLLIPENQTFSLKNNYLKGDFLLGKINSITPSKGVYSKCEFEVKKLIRFQDTLAVGGKIILFLKNEKNQIKEFDVCLINSDLIEIKNKNNPGEFDAELFWKHKSIDYLAFANEDNYYKIGKAEQDIFYFFTRLRNYFSGILEQKLSGNELAVAKALILGDRSSLDSEITSKFGNTGAMHVLAVSGLHVGILVQILTLFLGLFKKWISKNQSIIIALILVWIYASMTGLSASVVRSAIMFSLLAGSGLLNKSYSNYNVLAFSAFIILMWNPHFLFDIGFQLSYFAMLGIFMFHRPLSKTLIIKNKLLKTAYDGTMVGIAAQIMTVPLTLYYFHQFPNYFIITNLGLMIFSFLILAFGIALFSFNWIPFLNSGLAYLLYFSIFSMLFIIDSIDKFPNAVSQGFYLNIFIVLFLFFGILIFFYSLKKEKIKLLKISLASLFAITAGVVFIRYNQMKTEKVFFLNSDEITFIIKHEDKNYVFFANKKNERKKAEFIGKSFEKIYPGKLNYFEISNKKESHLKSKNLSVNIIRQKGGYEIEINGKKYFYVTSFYNTTEIGTKIIASHLEDPKAKYQLKKGAILFDL